jgi:GTP-binding protein EngB required for normal cell division
MLEWLAGLSIPAIPIITKCDKVSRNEKAKQSEMISRFSEYRRAGLPIFQPSPKKDVTMSGRG